MREVKTIIDAAKAALQGGLAYVRSADVFISPDTAYLPNRCKTPAIGLVDGGSVQGFLVEAEAVKGARDISSYKGWRAFMASAA